MSAHWHDPSWKYRKCENCRKNFNMEIDMIREKVNGIEVWVCPRCGSTKRV